MIEYKCEESNHLLIIHMLILRMVKVDEFSCLDNHLVLYRKYKPNFILIIINKIVLNQDNQFTIDG